MTELDTMYRVMILYMLNLVEYPLTNTQITNFVLEKEYTNYFTVQEAITSLLQTDLITAESTHNNTRYHLTDYGRQTLIFSTQKYPMPSKKISVLIFRLIILICDRKRQFFPITIKQLIMDMLSVVEFRINALTW